MRTAAPARDVGSSDQASRIAGPLPAVDLGIRLQHNQNSRRGGPMSVPRRSQKADGTVEGVRAIDLGATFADLRQEIESAVGRVLASGHYIGGPEVEGLETEFAAFCGVPHAV